MRVNYGYLLAGAKAARGMAVIIDVFRAFTCTPLMFALGLKKSILVSHPHEALALKNRDEKSAVFPLKVLTLEIRPAKFYSGEHPTLKAKQRFKELRPAFKVL